jgi:hypothetical protein
MAPLFLGWLTAAGPQGPPARLRRLGMGGGVGRGGGLVGLDQRGHAGGKARERQRQLDHFFLRRAERQHRYGRRLATLERIKLRRLQPDARDAADAGAEHEGIARLLRGIDLQAQPDRQVGFQRRDEGHDCLDLAAAHRDHRGLGDRRIFRVLEQLIQLAGIGAGFGLHAAQGPVAMGFLGIGLADLRLGRCGGRCSSGGRFGRGCRGLGGRRRGLGGGLRRCNSGAARQGEEGGDKCRRRPFGHGSLLPLVHVSQMLLTCRSGNVRAHCCTRCHLCVSVRAGDARLAWAGRHGPGPGGQGWCKRRVTDMKAG